MAKVAEVRPDSVTLTHALMTTRSDQGLMHDNQDAEAQVTQEVAQIKPKPVAKVKQSSGAKTGIIFLTLLNLIQSGALGFGYFVEYVGKLEEIERLKSKYEADLAHFQFTSNAEVIVEEEKEEVIVEEEKEEDKEEIIVDEEKEEEVVEDPPEEETNVMDDEDQREDASEEEEDPEAKLTDEGMEEDENPEKDDDKSVKETEASTAQANLDDDDEEEQADDFE